MYQDNEYHNKESIQTTFLDQMELLYKKFYRKLFLYALTYLGEEEEARDMVSDMFVQLWYKWKEEQTVRTPSASYLYAMLRSRCVDKLRRQEVENRYLQQLEKDRFDNEEDVKEYEQTVTRLYTAIQQLPEPGKTILHHCYFDHMTYQQTADKLQMSLPMVKKHMAKIFQLLRDKLKNDKGGRISRLISYLL
jgi:RNA polymerase sigma-70 factor (ECF subfamily)